MNVLVSLLLLLPFLAALVLLVFGGMLRPLRRIPAHEYEQLERAPAWWTVAVGVGLSMLSLLALAQMGPQGMQVYIGLSQRMILIDAYALWGIALLGAVLAVTALVPAARRSLVPHTLPHFFATLIFAGLALLVICGLQIPVILVAWLCVLAGVLVLWAILVRPDWRWEHMELVLVLALAGVLGTVGLLWLRSLAHGSDIAMIWNALLTAPARAANGATLCLLLGWLGPAIYLPWWVWTRRDDEAMVWLPSALLLAVSGVLAVIRVLFFAFPAGGAQIAQLLGTDQALLVTRILSWSLAWGLLVLLLGAFWAVFSLIKKRDAMDCRFLVCAMSGMLLLGVAGGILGITTGPDTARAAAMTGMLWSVMTWAGVLVVWLSAKNILKEMALTLREERWTLYASLWGTLGFIVVLPPLIGFHAIASLWSTWRQFGIPPLLVVIAMIVTAVSAGMILSQWQSTCAAERSRPGIGWGVVGPFMLTFILLITGLLAGPLSPVLKLIRRSLLQVD